MVRKRSEMLINIIPLIIVLILGGNYLYKFYQKDQLLKHNKIVYGEEQERLKEWALQHNAIAMDDPIYGHLEEHDFTLNISESFMHLHGKPVLFSGNLIDICKDKDTYYAIFEWLEPHPLGIRPTYIYLKCKTEQISKLKVLPLEQRELYVIAHISDVQTIGFSSLFSEFKSSRIWFDRTLLLAGELTDYMINTNPTFFFYRR